MRRSLCACATSAGRHVGRLELTSQRRNARNGRVPDLPRSRRSVEAPATAWSFLPSQKPKPAGPLGAWAISGDLRPNRPTSFESFGLLAGQGEGEARGGRRTWHESNRSMPDAAVAVWRLDLVHANQDRATSASAHWCSSRHRACLDASGLALAETAGVRSLVTFSPSTTYRAHP